MSKYDFAKRLKRMIKEESEIVKMESKIARKSAKYYEQMSALKTTLLKQEQKLSIYRKEVDKLKRENERLEKFKRKEEERLCATIQKIEQMQAEYQNTMQKKVGQRRTALMQMDCIRSIKKATQTLINMDALPHMIQGVTLCEKESSCEWKPFCIDPLIHTQKEVEDMIWHDDTQVNLVHRETWEKLILGDILTDKPSNLDAENGIVAMVT